MSLKGLVRKGETAGPKRHSQPRAAEHQPGPTRPLRHPAALFRLARASPAGLNAADVLQLQRAVGNGAVGRLMGCLAQRPVSGSGPGEPAQPPTSVREGPPGAQPGRPSLPVQAKLTVSQPVDSYERDADQVAKQVVNRIDEEGSGEEPVQRQGTSDGAAVLQVSGSGGPLAEHVRRPMERAFGMDFGGVRIHADAESDRLSRSIGARAFTTGRDIFLGHGEYSPGGRAGLELIAHELTHVLQQGGAVKSRDEQGWRPALGCDTPLRPAAEPADGHAQSGSRPRRYGRTSSRPFVPEATAPAPAIAGHAIQAKFTVGKEIISDSSDLLQDKLKGMAATNAQITVISFWAGTEEAGQAPPFEDWSSALEMAGKVAQVLALLKIDQVKRERDVAVGLLVAGSRVFGFVDNVLKIASSGTYIGNFDEFLGRMKSDRLRQGLLWEFLIALRHFDEDNKALLQFGSIAPRILVKQLSDLGFEEAASKLSEAKIEKLKVGADVVVWKKVTGSGGELARFIQAKNVVPSSVEEEMEGAANQLAGMSKSGEGSEREAEIAPPLQGFSGVIDMYIDLTGGKDSRANPTKWESMAQSLIRGKRQGRLGELRYVTEVRLTYADDTSKQTKVITGSSQTSEQVGKDVDTSALKHAEQKQTTTGGAPTKIVKLVPKLSEMYAVERGQIKTAYETGVAESLQQLIDIYTDATASYNPNNLLADKEQQWERFRLLLAEADTAETEEEGKKGPKNIKKPTRKATKKLEEPPPINPQLVERLIANIKKLFAGWEAQEQSFDEEWWDTRLAILYTAIMYPQKFPH